MKNTENEEHIKIFENISKSAKSNEKKFNMKKSVLLAAALKLKNIKIAIRSLRKKNSTILKRATSRENA